MVPLKLRPDCRLAGPIDIDFEKILLVEGAAVAEVKGDTASVCPEIVKGKPNEQPIARTVRKSNCVIRPV